MRESKSTISEAQTYQELGAFWDTKPPGNNGA